MNMGEVTGSIGTASGVVSLLVAIAAYRRAGAADRRDREAILVVDARDVDEDPERVVDARWTIGGNPTVSDGLVLREATASDDADKDAQNYVSHRMLLTVSNVGRHAATDIQLSVTLAAPFFVKAEIRHEDRTFSDSVVIHALSVGAPRLIEVRNITGLPVRLSFDGCVAGAEGDQPVRLVAQPLVFHARG